MTNNHKTLSFIRVLTWILLAYQFMVMLSTLSGQITFGLGLGDLGMLIIIFVVFVISVILQVIFYRVQSWYRSISKWGMLLAAYLIIALYFTYCFTLGRGPEHRWN